MIRFNYVGTVKVAPFEEVKLDLSDTLHGAKIKATKRGDIESIYLVTENGFEWVTSKLSNGKWVR